MKKRSRRYHLEQKQNFAWSIFLQKYLLRFLWKKYYGSIIELIKDWFDD